MYDLSTDNKGKLVLVISTLGFSATEIVIGSGKNVNVGTHIITGLRTNMNNKLMSAMDRIMLRKRSVIETINYELKNVAMLVHSRHRSFENFLMNVILVIAAYCFFDKKPAINMDFEVDGSMVPTLF